MSKPVPKAIQAWDSPYFCPGSPLGYQQGTELHPVLCSDTWHQQSKEWERTSSGGGVRGLWGWLCIGGDSESTAWHMTSEAWCWKSN